MAEEVNTLALNSLIIGWTMEIWLDGKEYLVRRMYKPDKNGFPVELVDITGFPTGRDPRLPIIDQSKQQP